MKRSLLIILLFLGLFMSITTNAQSKSTEADPIPELVVTVLTNTSEEVLIQFSENLTENNKQYYQLLRHGKTILVGNESGLMMKIYNLPDTNATEIITEGDLLEIRFKNPAFRPGKAKRFNTINRCINVIYNHLAETQARKQKKRFTDPELFLTLELENYNPFIGFDVQYKDYVPNPPLKIFPALPMGAPLKEIVVLND